MEQDPIVDRLGTGRAAELRAELASMGLELIDADERRQLERESAAYRRLAALVEPSPIDDPGPPNA